MWLVNKHACVLFVPNLPKHLSFVEFPFCKQTLLGYFYIKSTFECTLACLLSVFLILKLKFHKIQF